MFKHVSTVMTFASDPEACARWWADALSTDLHTDIADDGQVYAWIVVGGVEMGWHEADDARNPRGGSPVAYWAVPDLDTARKHLLDAGAEHWRGPLKVESGRRICQLRDPHGMIFGLEGP
ncbi:VOC family protein [Actinomadura harenae]|uniref:Glyoxalase n=1 Tax=Actinomadura harenae TaxID=2483351 RepID=A0A3M2MBC9_9ACTN|nr:VOC family protein [Actinomadura harenae]RMI46183.1 glyoxalase [Actinomadura harenae]